jgi:hypothetical protein
MGTPSVTISSIFPFIANTYGTGLNNGRVYIGVSGQDPEVYPLATYWDAALTVPASQPISTIGGYLVRAGAPASVYVGADYSMRVRDSGNVLISYNPLAGAGPVVQFREFGGGYEAPMQNSEVLLRYKAAVSGTIAANLSDWKVECFGNPVSSFVLAFSRLRAGVPAALGSNTIATDSTFVLATTSGIPQAVLASDTLLLTSPANGLSAGPATSIAVTARISL